MYTYMHNITDSYKERRDYLLKNEWPNNGSKGLHNPYRLQNNVMIHYNHNKVYALSYMFDDDNDYIKLYTIEVNPNYIRKGYGTKAFKNIALEVLKQGKGLILSSLDKESDAFYKALGMTQNQRVFIADKALLKQIIRM